MRTLKKFGGADFCSNDYLGLARTPLVAANLPNGSTGARLISGFAPEHCELEQDIAAFHGFEHSLLFSSGYSANTGLLACIADSGDAIISDELIHASLIDGIRLSKASKTRFSHNDVTHLEVLLSRVKAEIDGQIFVVIESLYSMDGDTAPLAEICARCEAHGAALIVDEAHSIGICGPQGQGSIAEQGLQDKVFAAVYTYGKAVGLHGAVVAGSSELRDYLINFCRPFIYTTALSPQVTEHIRAAYDRFRSADAERRALCEVLSYFEHHVKTADLKDAHWLDSQSPIQGLVVPGNDRARSLAEHLGKNDIAVKAILSPTVPEGGERLRISLHSHNTKAQMERLRDSLEAFLNRGTL